MRSGSINTYKLLKMVDRLARGKGATIRELQEDLELSRRSIYRLRSSIQSLGIPVYPGRDADGRTAVWHIEAEYVRKLGPNLLVPDVSLSEEEQTLLAFILSRSSLFTGTELTPIANSVQEKLRSAISNPRRKMQPMKTFVPDPKTLQVYKEHAGTLKKLMRAASDHRTCSVTYSSFKKGRIESFGIDPLTFFEHNGTLYLYVRISSTRKIRTIAVPRIKKIELTETTFLYPDDFKPESLRSASFAMVENDPITARIWFSSRHALYIKERRWSDKQAFKEQKDGSVILTLSTSGFDDVKHWILSYGAGAKVLAPKELREAMRQEVKGMKAFYELK